MKDYIETLFDEKDVPIELREKLWNHYFSKLSEGVDKGFTFDDAELAKSLKFSIAEFSAFKETAFKKDLEDLLTKDGKLTPKSEFLKEASKLDFDYNTRYLETEYHQTIANAQSAAQWKDFQENKDLYPNLMFVTVGDDRVRPEHQVLDGIIKPIDDPFWNSYYTPLDWGCRCSVEQTDAEPKGEPNGGLQLKLEFENNPGKTGKIFGESAYESRVTKTEGKEVRKNAEKWFNNQILLLPREKQFKTIYENKVGKVLEHILVSKIDDYQELIELSKSFAKLGNKVEMMPVINQKERRIRTLIFPNLSNKMSNPDIKISNKYFDLKRPSAIKNIEKNANNASKQGAIAVISDSKLDKPLTESIMKERAKGIFKNTNYKKNEVWFYKEKKLIVFNRTGD